MEGFIEWLKEHPAITIAAVVVGALLLLSNLKKQTGSPNAAGGSGAQGDLAGGQVVSAGGYTFVPTGSSDTSSNQSGDVNPNTAEELQALTGFLQAFQSAPSSASTGGAQTTPTVVPPDTTGGTVPTPPPITINNPPPTVSTPVTAQASAQATGKKVVTTKHKSGTPTQSPGVPVVAPHPANRSVLPPTRSQPVTHPAQGKTHPVAGPTTHMQTPTHIIKRKGA